MCLMVRLARLQKLVGKVDCLVQGAETNQWYITSTKTSYHINVHTYNTSEILVNCIINLSVKSSKYINITSNS